MRSTQARWQSVRRLYPFTSHYLRVDGVRLHYVDEGDGPAVLMLHGNPTWSFHFRHLIRDLSDRYRVVAPDHIGCGLSDKPQKYPYHLATHITNLERLIDHLGLTDVAIIVHDWGGAIGMGWAVRHPDRVRGIVILNTAAFPGPAPFRIRVCRWPWVGAFLVRGLNLFAGVAPSMGSHRHGAISDEAKRGYLLPYDSWSNRVAVHAFVRDIPLEANHPTRGLIEEIAGRLACLQDHPMTIFWGMRDFCFHAGFLDEWQRRFPNAEVHRFDDAGHFVLEDAYKDILPKTRSFLESINRSKRPATTTP